MVFNDIFCFLTCAKFCFQRSTGKIKPNLIQNAGNVDTWASLSLWGQDRGRGGDGKLLRWNQRAKSGAAGNKIWGPRNDKWRWMVMYPQLSSFYCSSSARPGKRTINVLTNLLDKWNFDFQTAPASSRVLLVGTWVGSGYFPGDLTKAAHNWWHLPLIYSLFIYPGKK